MLFSAPMVRAILDGSKTVTRRVMLWQPPDGWVPHSYGEVHKMVDGEPDVDQVIGWGLSNEDGDWAYPLKYQIGDKIWVRESLSTLDVTGARVERLQDINDSDAIAEGIEETMRGSHWRDHETGGFTRCPIESFKTLWESIYGPGSWDTNPWVVVINFKRVPA